MKQVIVMRTDLRNTEGHKVRSGKLIAQGAHASLGAVLPYVSALDGDAPPVDQWAKVREWLDGDFTKITLRVDSEEELLDVYKQAQEAGMIAYLIKDNGTTEFGGVPTITCCAIGPESEEALDRVTGGLKLF